MPKLLLLLQRNKGHIFLLSAILLTAPIIFLPSFRYSFPLGYAGMFTMIAEKITSSDFVLPMSIPHYGPGGIPLIYPPFAMYIFSVAMKLGAPMWAYLRLVPAIFSVISIIPLYYLTLELIESKSGSFIAVILIMTTPAVYYTHVWSAGIVRGLALALCLSGLLYYVRTIRSFSWQAFTFAGVLLGILLGTHWLYVLFAAIVGTACLVPEWKTNRVLISFCIMLLAFLVASPWLFIILERHGLSSLLVAYSSHRNVDFLQSAQGTLELIGENLNYVMDNWFITVLAIPGFILLLFRRKFHIPLAFIFVLFMGEASFYIEILAGMMAGAFCGVIFNYLSKKYTMKNMPPLRSVTITIGTLLLVVMIIASSAIGLRQIANYAPEIDSDSLEVAAFVKNNTDPEATYLFVGKINEAEWFPYLLDRTPVFSPWGSEWKGTYAEQSDILINLRGCELHKDWACMEKIQHTQQVSPSLLVVPNKRWLVQQIQSTNAWNRIFANNRYSVWVRRR
ncbi:MAG TPA: hypothetical protein DCX53_04745 [Anaerolineae bacterium]|nr:hypothetical protein [Anaerolineae bacterium]